MASGPGRRQTRAAGRAIGREASAWEGGREGRGWGEEEAGVHWPELPQFTWIQNGKNTPISRWGYEIQALVLSRVQPFATMLPARLLCP